MPLSAVAGRRAVLELLRDGRVLGGGTFNSFPLGMAGGLVSLRMLERIKGKRLPLVTSFYAPAIAADRSGTEKIYCIICDADMNRVWVAREPSESRIEYFAPCGRVVQRLKAYGVPDDRIFLTGFPLPLELVGGTEMATLKSDLGQRLFYLDPKKRFWPRYGVNVEHFLGAENCTFKGDRTLTITYSVGGAGALKEIGLPQVDVPLALLTFNLGVEAGQLLFVLAIVTGLRAAGALFTVPLAPARLVAAYSIGTASTVWLITRGASFWT